VEDVGRAGFVVLALVGVERDAEGLFEGRHFLVVGDQFSVISNQFSV
jgi:hypothetical protein